MPQGGHGVLPGGCVPPRVPLPSRLGHQPEPGLSSLPSYIKVATCTGSGLSKQLLETQTGRAGGGSATSRGLLYFLPTRRRGWGSRRRLHCSSSASSPHRPCSAGVALAGPDRAPLVALVALGTATVAQGERRPQAAPSSGQRGDVGPSTRWGHDLLRRAPGNVVICLRACRRKSRGVGVLAAQGAEETAASPPR